MWLVSTSAIPGNLPFRIDPGEFVVGRSRHSQIIVKDLTVSKCHARLMRSAKTVILADLESRNGTFVNELPVEEDTPVEIGDRVRFGSVTCVISSNAMLPAGFADSESTFVVNGRNSPALNVEGLTPAQKQVLALVLRGRDEDAIARRLGRSWHTIHTHLKAIFKHLGVRSRVELLAAFLNRGPAS